MFLSVPPSYDLINHLVTWGLDIRWRRLAAQTCLENNPETILDLGCGTGDLSVQLALLTDKDVEITGLDYSAPMLEKARQKAEKAGVIKRVKFISGEADKLPFPDSYFDCVGISFAFRNLTYKTPLRFPHLTEVKRVLRPGGRYIIVESSQPENRIVRGIFHLYVRLILRPAGTIISGNKGAYRYLAESMSRFYTPEEIREMLLKAGFETVNYRPLLFGVAGIHVAVK